MLLDAHQLGSRSDLGEDTWELFELIETSFGIELDYNALLGKSVREVAEVVAHQSAAPCSDICITSAVFYLLRKELASDCGLSRDSIRPDALLARVLPWKVRSRYWLHLQERLHLRLPKLMAPAWLLVTSLGLGVAGGALSWTLPGHHVLWTMVASVSASFLLLRASVSLGRAFPSGCRTVGDLVRLVAAHNYADLATLHGRAPLSQIELFLRQMIAANLGRDVTEIKPQTRIPEDVNIY